MPRPESTDPSTPGKGRRFEPTRWTEVIQVAQEGDSPEARQALEELCRVYWYPLYSYIRRRGYGDENGRDLTQGFFFHILERNFLGGADRKKGKFRSFLLSALNYYLSNERDFANAKKRGGGIPVVSLDEKEPDERYALEPVSDESPEVAFERRWALTLMDQALKRLQQELVRNGKGELFDKLRGFLEQGTEAGGYDNLAAELGMTPGAVAVAVRRLRARYGEVITEEISRTVGSAEEVEVERRHLYEVLSGA